MSDINRPDGRADHDQTPEPTDDLVARIERLVELRQVGHLTDEEFTQAKAALIAEAGPTSGPTPSPPPRASEIRSAGSDSGTTIGSGESTPPTTPWPTQTPTSGTPPITRPAYEQAGWASDVDPPPIGPGEADSEVSAVTEEAKSRKKIVIALILVILIALGGAVAYMIRNSRTPHQTVEGTFTIQKGSYSSPNFSGGAFGCEGDGGYGDLNSSTQVVVKDDNGDEVARTELGTGKDTSDELFGGCEFNFEFDVSKGPEYFVVSVGRRGESKYTYDELAEPEAIQLTIGS